MALLLLVFPPLVTLKLLLSALVLLLLAGAWYLAGAAGRERRWFAFLAFPLVYSALFHLGFYNFCFSVAFCLIAVGYWWRRRRDPDLGFALRINAILLLCYFSHLVSTVMALFAIAVLWLATLKRNGLRRHLRHVAVLAPQLLLPLWFLWAERGQPAPLASAAPFDFKWRYLLGLRAAVGFSPQTAIGGWLSAGFLVLGLASLAAELAVRVRHRPRRWLEETDAFLLVSLLAAAIYFVSPESLSGGSYLPQRLSLYPPLFLIPWLSGRLGGAVKAAGVAALSLVALLDLGLVASCYRSLDRSLQAFVHGLDPVRADTVVLPLLFDQWEPCARQLGVFAHAVGYAAVAKRLVDWDDYEGMTDYFPLRFRPAAHRGGVRQIEDRPAEVDVGVYRDRVDSIYCWRMRPDLPIVRRLDRHYVLVEDRGDSRLYATRPGSP